MLVRSYVLLIKAEVGRLFLVKQWARMKLLLALLSCLALPVLASEAFLGRWNVTVGNDAHWLDVMSVAPRLELRMVGRGSAAKTPAAELKDGRLLIHTKDWFNGKQEEVHYQLMAENGQLKGEMTRQDGTRVPVTGKKAPDLKRSQAPEFGQPIYLIPDGDQMTGWQPLSSGSLWKLEHGVLFTPQTGANIRTSKEFEDFRLHVEFKCEANSNSGVYLRGRYEVAIEAKPTDSHPTGWTGAIYGFQAPAFKPMIVPGEWNSFDITLIGRQVTVVLNGKPVVTNFEIPGSTGGALDSDESKPGPIYLQGDHGAIAFRNIILTPVK
jgi:hypothetical protein